jgi:broad specificity phosphatase PhoE
MLGRFLGRRGLSAAGFGALEMPVDLVLVRHGAAEGNLAFAESRKGNNDFFTPQFMETHESKWRLTREGRRQAGVTGRWLRRRVGAHFDRCVASEYVRALETAALLDLPNAHWERDVFLRERNFGQLSSLSYRERDRRFQNALRLRQLDAFYWAPPSGESLASVALRVDYVIDSLAEGARRLRSAVLVSHYNVIQVFRTRIEGIGQLDFEREIIRADRWHKLQNCSVIHYTRRHPMTHEVAPVYRWMRFATPWLGDRFADPPWEEIRYRYLTNEQILSQVEERTNQGTNERRNEVSNERTDEPTNQRTNAPTNGVSNEPTDEPTNQRTNAPTNGVSNERTE